MHVGTITVPAIAVKLSWPQLELTFNGQNCMRQSMHCQFQEIVKLFTFKGHSTMVCESNFK